MKRIQSFQSWDEEEEKKKEEERKTDRPMSFEEWQKKNSGTATSTPTSTPTQTSTPTPSSTTTRTTETATNRPVSFEQWDKQRRGEAEEEPERQYSSMDRYRPSGVYTPEQTEERKFSQNERYRPSGVVLGSPNVLEEPQPWDYLYTSGTIQRGKELAAKSTLTSEEKKEARAIQKEIDKVTRTSGVQKSDQYRELTDLNARLYAQSSKLGGLFYGAINALGLDWLTDRGSDVISEVIGLQPETGAKELAKIAQNNNPLAYAAGNVAGNVMELSAISGAVGKTLQGAEWFTKLAPWVQKAASSAITFGISGAASGIANTETKEEWDERERQQQLLAEDFGASYTPREYSIGQQLGKVGISTATGAASGALGSMLGSAFGAGTSNILVRNGLQYNTALRAIASGINGVGFAAGSTAAQELSKLLQYPQGYQPDAAEIGTNLAVAFLFSAAGGIIGDAKSAKANKEALLKMMDELAVEYETAKIKMAGMTGDARIAEAQKALAMSQRIRTSLATSPGMSGVQEEVKALAAALDIIDDQMGAIAAGGNGLLGASDIFSEAGSSVGEPLALAVQRIGANVPAPTGSAPQTQTIIPTTPQQAQTFPAWYQAYQNSPRPVDMPARQQPTLQLPTPPTPAQTQQGNVDTAPALPVPQNALQAPVAAETKRPPEPPAGLVLPTNNAPQELTRAQDTGIVEEKPIVPGQEESTLVNDEPAEHTAAEQRIIEEYKGSVDDSIKEAFEKYLANPDAPFDRYKISDVTTRQAEDASRLLGGDYSGYTNNINKNGITHILEEHGPNGTVNHSMADLNDAARIGYVLANYDNVEIARYKKSGEADYSKEFSDKNNRPAPKLKFSKKVNGTYYVIEAVPESSYKKFWVVSAYIGDNNAEGITQAPDAHGPQKTPEAQLPSLPSAEIRITRPDDAVKAPILPTAQETLSPAPKGITLPEASEPNTATRPHDALAESVRRELEEGNTITSQQLQELAEKAFGGTRGSGAYDIKTAYDAMELAVNQYLMDSDFVKQGNGDAAAAVRTEKGLQQVLSQIPTQSVRTEEQQQYQQFSTPPNIAYLAAWAANIDKGDTVLEPSAGIGGLG